MGIRDEGGRLSGLVAVVNHFPGMPEHGLTAEGTAPDEYDRNIQTADLNCLNAMVAVISWKKYLTYYAEFRPVDETVYRIFTGTIRNGEHDAKENAEDDVA